MLGEGQLLQGIVCGDTALQSQSLVSTGISSKAHTGTEQTWVPMHPSSLPYPCPQLGPDVTWSKHLWETSAVSWQWYQCLSSSTQHTGPVLLCCGSLGVSAQLCATTWSSSLGSGGTMANKGHQPPRAAGPPLPLPAAVLLRSWSHDCAGLLLRALGSAAGQDSGSVELQGGGTMPPATRTTGFCHCLPHLKLRVAMQKTRAAGSGAGSQHMPVWLGQSLPGAWTSRV